MKKILLCVFSGTGNTEKIANLFRDEFEKNGVATTVVKIVKNAKIDSVDDFDAVGICYPVHGFNAPYNVLEFAHNMPKTHDKPLFVLKSSGEPLQLNNVSSYKLVSILKKKGYAYFSEYHYVMPYNMIFRHDDATAYKMWRTAKELAPVEAREVLRLAPHKLKRIPFGRAIAFLFRIEHPAMKVNGRFFKVDMKKCVNCGLCVKNCPEENIKIENGKFVFGGDCACCVRCSFNCPKDAFDIALLNGWRVNGKYDMDNASARPTNRHAKYCKKSYARYFREANEKIANDVR